MTEHAHAHRHDQPADAVIDPVCGMTVDPHTTPHRHSHAGRTYYFCSAGCRTKFAADSGKYLADDARKTETVP
jgi:Cu+-exporting ATPase